jgi:hypothetical protein
MDPPSSRKRLPVLISAFSSQLSALSFFLQRYLLFVLLVSFVVKPVSALTKLCYRDPRTCLQIRGRPSSLPAMT